MITNGGSSMMPRHAGITIIMPHLRRQCGENLKTVILFPLLNFRYGTVSVEI